MNYREHLNIFFDDIDDIETDEQVQDEVYNDLMLMLLDYSGRANVEPLPLLNMLAHDMRRLARGGHFDNHPFYKELRS